jgi:erythronate-4-phosphate dehydrogenase
MPFSNFRKLLVNFAQNAASLKHSTFNLQHSTLMLTIVIDDHIPFIKGILEPFARIIYAKGGLIDRSLAMQADGLIIRTRTRCDAALLDGTPVKFIATATIGIDHIDTVYCDKNNISWHHAPGCNSSSVRQYIASALVSLATKHNLVLEGKKIGIVGVGHVGSKVAQLAQALGMITVLNDPPRQRAEKKGGFVTLEEIKNTCDIISLHVPLTLEGTDKTYKMADEGFFSSLGKMPLLLNTCRGDVVDTDAVKKALISGKISGFSADVWENEPAADLELLRMADIATPHIAGYSVEGKANGTAACVNAASHYFGFGLDNWYPPLLPGPENPVIVINHEGKPVSQILSEAILSCYDVMRDDALFRLDPSKFEILRNYYPVRREFGAFSLESKPLPPALRKALISIGFNLTTPNSTDQ